MCFSNRSMTDQVSDLETKIKDVDTLRARVTALEEKVKKK